MTDNAALEWHRLHPAMLLFQLAGILRRYFLLFVVGGVASSRGENFVNFVLLSTALALTVGLLRYFSYRYSLDEQYLSVTEGVFTKKSQRFLLDKINHVNRHQNPLAKWMGIVRLELQQEASNLPALILPSVTFRQAEEIEAAIQRHSAHVELSDVELSNVDTGQASSADSDDPDRQVLYQSTLIKSLLEGVSSLPIRILFVAGMLYRFYGRALTPYVVDEYELYLNTLMSFGIDKEHQFWLFVTVSVVFVVFVSMFIGVGAAFVRWFRYRVVVKSHLILIVSGFFTRSTRVINPQQIQALTGVANPVRRLFDLCQWQIVAPRPGGQRGRASQLVPIGKSAEISNLLPTIWASGVYPNGTENWLPVDPYHRRRLWLLTLFTVCIVVAIVASVDVAFNSLANETLWQRLLSASLPQLITAGIVVAMLLMLFHRLVQVNFSKTGYRLDNKFIFIQYAFLSQRSYVVPLEKIQAVIFHRSLMQLRRGLITIELDINGILRPVRLYNVSNDIAEHLRAKAVYAVNAQNI